MGCNMDDITWMTGMALNGLLQSTHYGAELQRIFDPALAISNTCADKVSPQEYTARVAYSLAEATMRCLNEPVEEENEKA